MQIVIDINEHLYKAIKTLGLVVEDRDAVAVSEAIKNGTPLVIPKGHGDLVDVNNLKHAFILWSTAVQGLFTDADIASIIYSSPIILKADKAESEE